MGELAEIKEPRQPASTHEQYERGLDLWLRHGQGGSKHDYAVELEPKFVPYVAAVATQPDIEDDGRFQRSGAISGTGSRGSLAAGRRGKRRAKKLATTR